MLKSNRITLLVIPAEGGKTFEVKIPRLLLWFVGLCSVALFGLLAQGFRSYFDVRDLDQTVTRLERDKALLEEEVGQIEQLEEMLIRLQHSNDQLRTILGESQGFDAETSQSSIDEIPYISSVQRLRWGHVQTVPTVWPVRGPVLRSFSAEWPSVFIGATAGSLVRASAAGEVVRAGYDERLGFFISLDHGNGLQTQYGYNARLLVIVGDYVRKGQSIALSGEGRESRGAGLYYAVREDGQFRDPALYKLWM